MNLRTHLHAWLHPRDPLLEAWKYDPFVEAMVARERKVRWGLDALLAPLLLRRWGCLSVFIVTILLHELVPRSPSLAIVPGLDGSPTTFLIVFILVLLLREGLVLLRRHYLRRVRSRASFMVLMQSSGHNPILLDLWMAGLRGRDMVKALHVVLCQRPMRRGLWLFGAFVLFTILLWEPVTRAGILGIASYILLAAWFRWVYVYFRFSHLNPLNSVINRLLGSPPAYIRPALDAASIAEDDGGRELAPTSSAIFVLSGTLIPVIYGNVVEQSPMEPGGLLVLQLICLAFANLIILSHRVGSTLHLRERLEDSFIIVDEQFDLHIRRHIIQDPDAERRS